MKIIDHKINLENTTLEITGNCNCGKIVTVGLNVYFEILIDKTMIGYESIPNQKDQISEKATLLNIMDELKSKIDIKIY